MGKRVKISCKLEPLIAECFRILFPNSTLSSTNVRLKHILSHIIEHQRDYMNISGQSIVQDSNLLVSVFYHTGIQMREHLEGIKRMEDKYTDLPTICKASELHIFDRSFLPRTNFVIRLFGALINGVRMLPSNAELGTFEKNAIQMFISLSIKILKDRYISLIGRKISIIIHSISKSKKALEFLSQSVPVGILSGVGVNELLNRNINSNLIHQFYDYNQIASNYDNPIFCFSVDNLQYSKYVNSDVSSGKFNVALVTTSLIWIGEGGKGISSECDPSVWRGSICEIKEELIETILYISDCEFNIAINSIKIIFPRSKKNESKLNCKKTLSFGSLFHFETNQMNCFFSDVIKADPSKTSDLIHLLELQTKRTIEVEQKIKLIKNDQSTQPFKVVIMDGAPGKQLIRSLFGLKGNAMQKAEGELNASIDNSVIYIPGIMHVCMIINKIVLSYIDEFFPWMFTVFGVSNPKFKQSIIASTNFRKSYGIAKRCTEALYDRILQCYKNLHYDKDKYSLSDAVEWAGKCEDFTLNIIGTLAKFIFPALHLVERRSMDPDRIILAMRIIMHSCLPDHPNYSQIISLFLVQYYKAPDPVKEIIKQFLIIEKNEKYYNDEVHEFYNRDIQDLVRSTTTVTQEDYVKAAKRHPYIEILKQSMGVTTRITKHRYPHDTWQSENYDVHYLLSTYEFNKGRDFFLKIQPGKSSLTPNIVKEIIWKKYFLIYLNQNMLYIIF